jgi:hypothetical protein
VEKCDTCGVRRRHPVSLPCRTRVEAFLGAVLGAGLCGAFWNLRATHEPRSRDRLDELGEIGERPREAVHLVDDDHIHAAVPHALELGAPPRRVDALTGALRALRCKAGRLSACRIPLACRTLVRCAGNQGVRAVGSGCSATASSGLPDRAICIARPSR